MPSPHAKSRRILIQIYCRLAQLLSSPTLLMRTRLHRIRDATALIVLDDEVVLHLRGSVKVHLPLLLIAQRQNIRVARAVLAERWRTRRVLPDAVHMTGGVAAPKASASGSSCNVQAMYSAIEDCLRELWLEEPDVVAGVVDAHEGKRACLSNLASDRVAREGQVSDAGGGEGIGVCERDGVGDSFAAQPCELTLAGSKRVCNQGFKLTVTCIITVAIHHHHRHSSVHDTCQRLKGSTFGVVACLGEGLFYGRGVCGEVDGYTQCLLDMLLIQVSVEKF